MMASPKIIGLAEPVKPRIIGLADESQEPEEEQFLQPKQESFLDKLPRNIAIGLAKLGHRTTNLPYQTAKDIQNLSEPFGKFQRQHLPALQGTQKQESYLEKMVNQFNQEHNVPEELKNKNWGFNVENIPHQQEQNYPEMFGQQGRGTLIDRLIQGGLEHAPDIASLSSLARGGFRRLKGTHQLDEVRRAVNEASLSNFSYPEELIEESRNFLPQGVSTNEMINAVRRGEYNPAFSMQSQVGHHQRNLARSPLAAERLMSPRAGDLKQNMIGYLQDVLRSNGMEREANLLRQGIGNYRVYQQVKGSVLPVLKKMGIPTTILAAIGFGTHKIKKDLIK